MYNLIHTLKPHQRSYAATTTAYHSVTILVPITQHPPEHPFTINGGRLKKRPDTANPVPAGEEDEIST